MNFTAIKVSGADAVRTLNDYRSQFPATRRYPFLIGDHEELERLQEAAEFNEENSGEIIKSSLDTDVFEWIAGRRKESEEYEFSPGDLLGEWPGEILDKGSIGLHKDVLSRRIKPEVYLGIATLDLPWQLPAILKYGAWNDCPEAAVHCAFHRKWQSEFGAEITGMSGDVVECIVSKPPLDRETAVRLAWEQYWYCTDIVEQGCGTVSNLAATLLNSPYWFFWWD